ncbi:MAG: cell wall-binding repeat-containing protein [Lachnospiraceae bacterium]|nr:cell wall-binding repeat-containing protein [Lachnospiraceae bacterium]
MANSLETINLGQNNSLTYIGNGAFRNQSHVTKIDFGTSDAELTISWGAFIGIGNNTYLVESGAEDTLNKGIDTLKLPANLKDLRDGAFGFAGIRNLVFSNGIGISALEAGSFQDLDLMKKLVLGADFTVTRLDGGAFSKCDELKTIDLRFTPITNIDDAIKENAKLTSIIFPEKLESITWTYEETDSEEVREGKCPFYGCGNVNELTFTGVDPSGMSFDQGVFRFLNEAGTVYVPAETTDEQIEAYRAKLTGAGLNIDEKDHWKLRRLGMKTTRVFGTTRYKTSIAVAEELKELLGIVKFDTIFIATGENPVDALAGSYLSVNMKAPILMIQNKKTPIKLVTDFVKENLAKNGTVYVFGGENAVPEACLEGLKGYDVRRIAGSTRWKTNIMINEILGVRQGEEVLICDGIGEKDENGVEQYAYADSLSASASGKPMLLVDGSASSLKNYQKEYLKKLAAKGCRFTILGGEKAVSAEMKAEIESITGKTAERLAGATRYRTSAALAERYFANARKMVLANGENFPDGLCGGVLANALGGPVFLVKGTAVPTSLAKEFAQGHAVLEAIVLGGDKAVTDSTVREVFGLGAEEEIIVHQVK